MNGQEACSETGRRVECGHAFTLLELLVAMAIALVLAVLVLSLAANVSARLVRVNERMQTQAAARFAFDRITRDFESIATRNSPAEWFTMNPTSLTNSGFSPPPSDELMFLTTACDRPNLSADDGQISAVHYGLADRPLQSSATNGFFGLYRTLIDATKTFEHTATNNSLAGLWKNGGAFEPEIAARGNLLCPNAVSFRVILNFLLDDGRLESAERLLSLGTNWTASSSGSPYRQLVSVEVHLTLLSKRGEQAREEGQLSDEQLLREYGYSYSRLIPIRAAPVREDSF